MRRHSPFCLSSISESECKSRVKSCLNLVMNLTELSISCPVVKAFSFSPFPTRWGQRPEFLISGMFCPGHSGVIRSTCISLRTPSIHLPLGLPLGLFPGSLMSPTALASLFSSILCMYLYQRSLISLTFCCMLLTPSSFLMSTLYSVSQCYSFNSSRHPRLCFLYNLFLLLSNCPTFCSIQKYWFNDSHVELDL